MTDQKAPVRPTYPNPYAIQWRQFRGATRNHQLTVLHDDGLYRHLRMAEPGTGIWSWNVVTWPWHLYVGGDIGSGFVWSREEDMLRFMDTANYGDYHSDGSPHLQADYWSEKLDIACRDRARRYSPELFTKRVREAIADGLLGGWIARQESKELREELTWVDPHDEVSAREWLSSHRKEFPDAWEWDLQDWDHHYLLAAYGVVTTIRAYRAAQSAAAH